MKNGCIFLILGVVIGASSARGDFQAGLTAHRNGDYQTAMREWLPLAEKGDAVAQTAVGALYQYGNGVPIDYAQAAEWYRKAAQQGLPLAQYNLAVSYALGEGVPQNYAEALRWYRMAAEQGHAEAKLAIGRLYANGQGAEKDYREAAKWYRQAAEAGVAAAQASLGAIYVTGPDYLRDFSEAAKWFRLAAERGDSNGQLGLGLLYGDGLGVTQDYVEAFMWLSLAASTNAIASPVRDELAKLMSREQIALAQDLTRNWRPKSLEKPADIRSETAQSSEKLAIAGLEKIIRYIDNDMYEEALAQLHTAIRNEEFNPQIRLALGYVLFRQSNYDEAIRQLQISRKLDPRLWQATELLADAYLKRWETQKAIGDRLQACRIYDELATLNQSSAALEAKVSMFAHPNDLSSSKLRAHKLRTQLESPAGKWRDDRGEIYGMKRGEGVWALGPIGSNPESFQFFLDNQQGTSLTGWASQTGTCPTRSSAKVDVMEHGTQMIVRGRLEQVITSRQVPSFCGKLLNPQVGRDWIQIVLYRTE